MRAVGGRKNGNFSEQTGENPRLSLTILGSRGFPRLP